MKMKAILSVLIVCVLPLVSNAASRRELPFKTADLVLADRLTPTAKASQDIVRITTNFSAKLRQGDAYDANFVQQTAAFVVSNKTDTAALTAKLYLAFYLSAVRKNFAGDNESVQLLDETVRTLFSDMASKSPNTWEGRLSAVYSSGVFLAQEKQDKKALIAQARQVLPTLALLETDPGFMDFKRLLGAAEPVELSIRVQMIRWYLDIGDTVAADNELRECNRKYPTSKSLKRMEKAVAEIKPGQGQSK
jgi:hypothetical protein